MMRLAFAFLLSLCVSAQAQLSGGVGGFPGPGTAHSTGGACGSRSIANINGVTDNGTGSATVTLTGDIGTATATRVVLIAASRQNNGGFSGITVGGQAATSVQAATNNRIEFWAYVGSAAGSGSQNIVATGGTFELRSLRAWVMDGLTSTTKVQSSMATSANSIGSISLQTCDYWFAAAFTIATPTNWNSSSPAPTEQYNESAGDGVSARWTIGSNTTGTATVSGGTTDIVQVSYR